MNCAAVQYLAKACSVELLSREQATEIIRTCLPWWLVITVPARSIRWVTFVG